MSKVLIGKAVVNLTFDAIDVDIVQSDTPVVTGNLRDHFQVEFGTGDIINPVEYADEVEFGTVDRPGRFMATQNLPELGERMVERIEKQLASQMIISPIDIRIVIK